MPLIDVFIIWLHLICASIWVGGSIFLGLILAPMLGSITNSMEERLSIMIRVGRRFNMVALPSFLVLILTGLYNSRAYLIDPSTLIRTDYGIILLIRIVVVIAVLILISYILDFSATRLKRGSRLKMFMVSMFNLYVRE